jgi:hypothetical protein
VGWLAWVTQLFRDVVDADYIITNAAAYWLTGTVGSSIRRYYEDAHTVEPRPGRRRHRPVSRSSPKTSSRSASSPTAITPTS